MRRARPSLRALFRLFPAEIILVAMYIVFIGVGVWRGYIHPVTIITSLVITALLVINIWRAVQAYRLGFNTGIDALHLAVKMGGDSPSAAAAKDGAELLLRSSELWDPSPAAVAHTMEIERLEKHANE